MYYNAKNDQYVIPGKAFVLEGVQYPANWLYLATPVDRANAGLVEVVTIGTPGDTRFYFITEHLNGAQRVYTNIPREITGIKESLISECKRASYSYLAPTDYKFTRQAETGEAVDQDTLDFRAAVRTACDNNIAAIEAAQDVETLAALQFVWPGM
jgi:hypothetical protein